MRSVLCLGRKRPNDTQGAAFRWGLGGNSSQASGNLIGMSKPRHYRTAEAASLSVDFQACIDTLTDLGSAELAAIPEPDRPAALAAGKVGIIGPVLGTYVAGLYAARDADWLLALRRIRNAIAMGFAPHQAIDVVARVHQGIAAELQTPGFSRSLFSPSALALVRWVELKMNYPCAPEHDVATDIVMVEQRPTVEIREVFASPFLAEVPTGAAQDAYLDGLLEAANDTGLPAAHRAEALVTMASLALAGHDLPAAVKLVAMAVRLAPDDDQVGVAASSLWVAINAAGREGKLVAAQDCPAWLDVVAVLHGALAFESRHSAGMPAGVDRPAGADQESAP